MADTMQFDLVSPERRLASVQAKAVQIPGADGDMTAMPDHAATMTTLRPGIVTVEGESGETKYVVTGGFAEITAEGTSVLAEEAIAVEDMTADALSAMVKVATEAKDAAAPEEADALAKRLSDLENLGAALGISA